MFTRLITKTQTIPLKNGLNRILRYDVRVLTYLFIMTLCYSCAPSLRHNVKVDSELQPYVWQFETLSKRAINKLQAGFSNLKPPQIGVCILTEDDAEPPTIAIDYTFWGNATDLEKEQLMYHELAHCVFRRGHTEELMANGCAVSIMHPRMIPDSCYETYREHYLNELFK